MRRFVPTSVSTGLIAFALVMSAAAVAMPAIAASESSEPVCVVKANVRLRKGPGSKFPVTWSVPKYMPLAKIDRKGSWLKVEDVDGQVHWVQASDVSRKVTCAVVRSKTAQLHRAPGSEPADLSSVDKYTPFRKIDRDGEWVQVKDTYRGIYWVHETNVWIPVSRTKVSF